MDSPTQGRPSQSLSFPAQISADEIKIERSGGSDFHFKVDTAKKAIIEAFATSVKMRDDAVNKMVNTLKVKLGKSIQTVTCEADRDLNSFSINCNSLLVLRVRSLVIYFFTPW